MSGRTSKALASILLALIIVSATNLRSEEPKYHIGVHGGLSRLLGGDTTSVPYQRAFGAHLGYRIGRAWDLDLDLTRLVLRNDTSHASSFSITRAEEHDTWKFRGTRLGLTINRDLLPQTQDLRWSLGIGGGLMIWSIGDPVNDTTFHVPGPHDETMDYGATEVIFSGQSEFGVALSQQWSLGMRMRADFMSGWGTDFASQVTSARAKVQLGGMLMLTYWFGSTEYGWKSTRNWVQPEPTPEIVIRGPDGDGDGVPDDDDDCPNTQAGVRVNKRGCALDSDRDGVPDGLDDCPGTEKRARGRVDIYGCPIDSDYDGVPDYRDDCPRNSVGAEIDSLGCPLDGDGDGVPDGLDDCPFTLTGMAIDPHGCIDLSMLSKPLVLNIDYVSGSFDVDPKTRERLKKLARLLHFVSDVKLEINGYTDNIGLPSANRKLSEKRANRVMQFLIAQEIDPERMNAYGRGEIDFVASNQTAEGRGRNRRVEIVFYY